MKSFALLACLALSGCNCDNRVTRIEPEPGPDAGLDAGQACGSGAVAGRVCSPSARDWVAGATVMLDATDCSGASVHLETVSDPQGAFTLAVVPAGTWTVHAQSRCRPGRRRG